MTDYYKFLLIPQIILFYVGRMFDDSTWYINSDPYETGF